MIMRQRCGYQSMDGEDEEVPRGANGRMTVGACKTTPNSRIPSYYEFATNTSQTPTGAARGSSTSFDA